jgi:pyrroloquinoline quinone (PQQ) biosynthesis protein C
MLVGADFAQAMVRRVTEGMPGAVHPFNQKLHAGRATRADLAVFAVQTYHRNLYSSRFASANHSRCPVPEIRRALLEVATEEELKQAGEPPSHADLVLVFAEAVGLRREDVVQSRPVPSTLVFIDTIMQLSQGHWLEGIAFRASEINAPKGCARSIHTLQTHYGFAAEALAWWGRHAEADVEHGNIALDTYEKYARDESEQAIASRALERMLAAWWVFYDGIARAGEDALAGRDVGFPLPAGVV